MATLLEAANELKSMGLLGENKQFNIMLRKAWDYSYGIFYNPKNQLFYTIRINYNSFQKKFMYEGADTHKYKYNPSYEDLISNDFIALKSDVLYNSTQEQLDSLW